MAVIGVISFTNGENQIEYVNKITSMTHLKAFWDFKYDLLRFHEYLPDNPERFWALLEDKRWLDKPWPQGYGTPHWTLYYVESNGTRVPLNYWNFMQKVSHYDLKQRTYTDLEIQF